MNPFRSIVALSVLTSIAIAIAAGVWHFGYAAEAPLPVLPPAKDAAAEHLPFGPVRPVKALPAMTVTLNDGRKVPLATVLQGRWTLVQFVFTGCSITCPVQGAIFADAQKRMPKDATDVALLSVSIDTLGDTPERLTSWLQRFGAGPGWQAALPDDSGLAALLDIMGGRSKSVDLHDARIYLFQPDGKLAYITEEMPDPAQLVRLIGEARTAGAQL